MDFMERLHERRIAKLADACSRALREGAPAEARSAWDELKAAVEARSPQQIERLERLKGLAR